MFSMEVSLGNLLTVFSILGGWLVFLMSLRGQLLLLNQALSNVDRRLVSVETAISGFSNSMIQLAKQEVRLDSHARRLEHLEVQKKVTQ